ncbi:trimeric intracellular cation channel family protein [Mycobacterium paraense]|uniref:trimeric intracellular cation channel family protein n=1 Tax=Mycobacterium paraense TaxID=767916 RepID=UPI001F4D7FB7|nr:TRIC cation channel family protein [Mycobacterium paraense]
MRGNELKGIVDVAIAELTQTDLYRAIDLTGVLGNALLGGVVARRGKLDPVGFAALAVLSGLGGGMIRDTLLQRGTPVALTDYAYLLTALVGAAIAFVFRVEGRLWNWAWPIVDGLALGCWAATGAHKTLAMGLGWLAALLLGTISAVGGGVTRDIVMRRVPGIFGGNTLYATCALAASAVLVIFNYRNHPTPGLLVGTLTGTVLCWLSQWRGWMLPAADTWSPATLFLRHRRNRRGLER